MNVLVALHHFDRADPGGWSLSLFGDRLRISRYRNQKYFTDGKRWTFVIGMRVWHHG